MQIIKNIYHFAYQGSVFHCFVVVLACSQAVSLLDFLAAVNSLFRYFLRPIRLNNRSLFCCYSFSIYRLCHSADWLRDALHASTSTDWRAWSERRKSPHFSESLWEKVIIIEHRPKSEASFPTFFASGEKGAEKLFIFLIFETRWFKEIFKQAVCIWESKILKSPHFGPIEPIVIICLTLLSIRQYLICLRNLSKFFLCLFFVVGVFVRMPFNRQLLVGFFYLFIGGWLSNPEHFVVVSFLLWHCEFDYYKNEVVQIRDWKILENKRQLIKRSIEIDDQGISSFNQNILQSSSFLFILARCFSSQLAY